MPKRLPFRSFKMKLLFMIWIGSTATLFLACGFFIFFEIAEFDKDLIKEMRTISNFIADKSAQAVMFNDPVIAEDALLSAVATESSIVRTIIYDREANVVATYERNPSHYKNFAIPEPQQNTASFIDGDLHLFSDIAMYSDRVGTVYIHADRHVLRKRIQRYAIIVAGIMSISLLFIAAISLFLQKFISTPIMALIASAKQVSENKDYTIRVKNKSDDELGILIDAFNEMLAQIQENDGALRESEKQFRTFVEQAADAFFLIDPDTSKFVDVNRTACDVLKYSREEILTLSVQDIGPSEQKGNFKESTRALQIGDTITLEAIHKRRDGVTFPVEIRSSLIEMRGKKRILALARDITERKQFESRIQQAQKMEAIGTLAGGIAHDFNNILSPILGHTAMLLEDTPVGTNRDSLDEIYTASLRARDLVKQILTFSRQDSDEIKLIKMQPIVKEALKLTRSTIPTSIVIKQNIRNDCGTIKADPTQIHQIVMNLATNAYHAMENTGGELIVNLKEIELENQDIVISDMEPGPYAHLSIADTGIGMEKDVLKKIFDPFYTTKVRSKGTGMGLSVVHGIVKNAGGGINAYSEPGKGTVFHIYLPVVKSPSEQQEMQTNEPIPVGSERILLVDDESAIASLGKKMLERLGYQVVILTSSLEALETFRKNPGYFDMVITDMAMPNMTGNKLSVELMKIRPDIPIIICSGFSEQISIEKAEALGIKGFLLKPVLKKDLAKKVREILG